MNQQNRPWKKISVASEKKRVEHWSCFCSQVQFSIWCCILKLTKWLYFERAQYCLISNASVFLENLCKPEPVGGALFYGNSSKFLFSNPPGLALFHIACKKFSIWSKNQIFWFTASETNQIYGIDILTDRVIDSIQVASYPESIIIDNSNQLWVLCRGDEDAQKTGAR